METYEEKTEALSIYFGEFKKILGERVYSQLQHYDVKLEPRRQHVGDTLIVYGTEQNIYGRCVHFAKDASMDHVILCLFGLVGRMSRDIYELGIQDNQNAIKKQLGL